MKKIKRLPLLLPEELYEWVAKRAKITDSSMSRFIRLLITADHEAEHLKRKANAKR